MQVLTPMVEVSTPRRNGSIFERCKGSKQALIDHQPPPTATLSSKPSNTSLQQHLWVEQQCYNMD